MLPAEKAVATKNRCSMLPSNPKTSDLDKYLELELNKAQCRVRSFALGGMPYLERNQPVSSPQTRELIDDVISGRLTSTVLSMFDGIEVADLRELTCFVTDRRQSIVVSSSVTLVFPESSEPVFRVHHARSPSHDTAINDQEGGPL
jgi:hypothetical protein